jgi:hypothetical protein
MSPMRDMLATSLLFSSLAAAQPPAEMQTDWMEFVKGHTGNQVGAQVRGVESDPETGERRLIVAIPKEVLQDESMMEEVRVVGRAPDKVEFELPEFETQWIDDYDNDYYGLLVRLKDGPETPIRLFFNAAGAGGVIDNGPQP